MEPIYVVPLDTPKPGVEIYPYFPELAARQINHIPCVPGCIGGRHMHPPVDEGWGRSKSPVEEIVVCLAELLVVGWNPDTGGVTDIVMADGRKVFQKVVIPAGRAHLTLGLGNSIGIMTESFCQPYNANDDPTIRYDVLPPAVQEVVERYQRVMRDMFTSNGLGTDGQRSCLSPSLIGSSGHPDDPGLNNWRIGFEQDRLGPDGWPW